MPDKNKELDIKILSRGQFSVFNLKIEYLLSAILYFLADFKNYTLNALPSGIND